MAEPYLRYIIGSPMTNEPYAETGLEKPVYYCNFCGKSTEEVTAMIAGPRTFICDECVELCTSMFAEEAAKVDAEKQERHVGLPGEFRTPNEWEQRQGGIWARTILKRLPSGMLSPADLASALDFVGRFAMRLIRIGYQRGYHDGMNPDYAFHRGYDAKGSRKSRTENRNDNGVS